MGNGMNKILPGLYIGNFRDAKDLKQITENNITHIVSIHDNAKKILEDKEYLCIAASDSPEQDLVKFFPQVNKFIHRARLEGGSVLVHCLAGVSRSVTITAAYIMTVTNLGWRDALNSIRGARSVANPNFGFQKQLQNYENEHLEEERRKLKAMFPDNPFRDEEECQINLRCFQQYIMTGNLPSRSDDLYPLPHRAYEGKARREACSKQNQNVLEKVESNVHSISKGKKSSCHHRHHHHHGHHKKRHHALGKSEESDNSKNDESTENKTETSTNNDNQPDRAEQQTDNNEDNESSSTSQEEAEETEPESSVAQPDGNGNDGSFSAASS